MMRIGSGAGLGDPYWYEWSVGQGYMLDMLEPGSDILSVTLQKTGEKGLDDVVVRFSNGNARFIQVKHTRTEDTLTFGDLVTPGENEPALLRQIASAWLTEAQRTTGKCDAWLVTNRAAGERHTRTKGILRPPLRDFLEHLAKEVGKACSIKDVAFPSEWQDAWTKEWVPQLQGLADDQDKLRFLQCFEVRPSTEGLDELGERLLARLCTLFSIDREAATGLLSRLDTALRKWATSSRGDREEVTREAVYTTLCLAEDAPVGDHDLVPPAPFFATRILVADELGSLLASRSEPVIFIAGEPGSGKTALLSFLANRREPNIDIRFHAYRPITPENQILPADAGRTTTARALWADLLLQIRDFARGRLASLAVPVHAASLSVDALREHVLRLAEALGQDLGRPFVIAVDGIDHAARAGVLQHSFLNALVAPAQVPPHVVFLLGGQPPEAYPNYPPWLRSPTSGVKRFDLPRLGFGDTRDLVRARLPAAEEPDHENVARDVWQRCQGNTLSTVFAVEEATLAAASLSKVGAVLDERCIASGIEDYYKAIWSAAVRSLSSVTCSRLAAALCLTPVRATAETVRAVLGEEAASSTACTDLLRQLRPLVVEEPDGFRVFQNDVRVFLTRLLQADSTTYRDCASRLADHLLVRGDAVARHAAAQKLFGVAGRPRDQADLFTPGYVLEGHAIGQPLDELAEQGVTAVEALASAESDWDLAHRVATGLRTLEQLRGSLQWRGTDEEGRRPALDVHRTLHSERRVTPRREWTERVLRSTLDEISQLVSAGQLSRASATYSRWFRGLSPAQVISDLKRPSPAMADHAIKDALRDILKKLGALSVAVGCPLPLSTGEGVQELEANFASGLLAGLPACRSDRAFVRILQRVKGVYFRDFQHLLDVLLDRRAWLRCKALLAAKPPRPNAPWSHRIQGAAAAALLGDSDLRSTWVEPVLSNPHAAIAGANAENERLLPLTWLAFLLGCELPTREASGIREEIEDVYYSSARDPRKDGAVAQVLHAAALLGSYVRTARDHRSRAIHVTPNTVARVVDVLIAGPGLAAHLLPLGYHSIAERLVTGLTDCAKTDPDVYGGILNVMVEHIKRGRHQGLLLEFVWRTLWAAAYRDVLLEYADRWIGTHGLAWKEAPADRYEAVTTLVALLAEAGETTRAAEVRERLSWADIGYSNHKEYVLRQPLEWFRALSMTSPGVWRSEGVRLMAISREASRTGDNRLSSQIDSEVLGAASVEGPSALSSLASRLYGAGEIDDRDIVEGLISTVRRTRPLRSDLLAMWAFCTGSFCWQVDEDRRWLHDLREAVLEVGRASGFGDLADTLSASASAEFVAAPEKAETTQASTRNYSLLAHEPIHDAMQRMCGASDWQGVAHVLDRVASEHPPSATLLIEMAWEALGRRPQQVWWFDGAETAYAAIFPLLTPAQRWEGVTREVANREQRSPFGRVSALADNLDDLCRLSASLAGHEPLRGGLGRLLDMHELWISGCGRMPLVADVPLAPDVGVIGWGAVFLEFLFHRLTFDQQAYVQAALRGIYRLLTFDPALQRRAVALAQVASPEVVRRFLLLAEPLLARESAPEALRAWCKELAASPGVGLDVALAAWSALRVAARVTGEQEPPWESPPAQGPVVVPVAPPLLLGAPDQWGLHTSASRASTSVLDHLEEACGADVDDLRSVLAASVRDSPPSVRPESFRYSHVGDMVADRLSEAEVDRLFALLRQRERSGRFTGVPASRLAQALVPHADPFVFLETPRRMSVPTHWPVDSDL
ncbi:MAG: AAA family ATPase [Myxococcales bacterium]